MAKVGIDKARMGGAVAEAYGLHVTGGTLVSHEIETVNNQKQVKLKALLGRGEWDGLQRVTYDGLDIGGDRYQFFPGGASTPSDGYFPNQIRHRGIARISVNLPQGASGDDDPTKLAVIVRCKKVQQLNLDGSDESYGWSTNPANQFLDAIKMDSERKGLNYKDRIDLPYYRAALDWCAASLQIPNYGGGPKNFTAQITNTGSITAGSYAVSIQAFLQDGGVTIRTGEVIVSLSGANKAIIITGDPVPGANAYSIWVRRINESTYYRTHVGIPIINNKVTYTLTALGNVEGLIPASGSQLLTRPRMESHCAFTSATSLHDVLNAICFQSCLDWQKVGGRYRILLPHNRPVSHHFNEGNTMSGSFKYGRVEEKDRYNRTIIKFREVTDPYLRPADEPVQIDREAAQAKYNVIKEEIELWAMSRHQAMRVGSYRMKQLFDRSMHCQFEDDASGARLLPGDIVEVSDKGAEWVHKKFVILEIERQDTDTLGRRKYYLKEWYDLDYQDSDGDKLPVSGIELPQSQSKLAPPQPILSLLRTLEYEVKADGVVNNLITLKAQFQPHIIAQVGRVFHRKPGAVSYDALGLMHPDPDSNGASFYLNMAGVGIHYFKIQVESALGVIQAETPVVHDLNVLPYAAAPARPTTALIERSSSLLKTTWVPSSTPNTGEYLITDQGGNEVARISGNFYEESVPDDESVTRRIYTVSTTGEVSLDYAQVVYSPDYDDRRIVFETAIGSNNFVPFGSDEKAFEEESVVYTPASYGNYNTDTKIWQRDNTPDHWSRGWRADRFVAYGGCEVSFKVPYGYNAQTTSMAFGLGYGTHKPDGLASMRYSMLAKTAFPGAANVPGLSWFVGSTEYFPNPTITFALNDILRIKITGTTVSFWKNEEVLYVALNQTVPYPLYLDIYQYFSSGTITPASFKIKGFLQDYATVGSGTPDLQPFTRPHWRIQRGIKFDAFYNLVRSASGTGWNASGCSSIESFFGGGFVEFRHPNPDQTFCVACGLNDVDTDQNYVNIEYCVLVGSAAGLGLSNSGLRIYEAGVLKFTLDQQLDASHIIRIAVEGGVVRYRLNGITLYSSLNIPPSTARWFADTALLKENDILPDVIMGDVGSRTEGWRVKPDGTAEFGKRIVIGGSPIGQVEARAITAINVDNRYRGNDFGVPETAQLNADMFRLDGVNIIDQDWSYTDLYLDIPDSVLKNTYANFDSVNTCRVRLFNIFGDEQKSVEHAFSGRGKVVVGVHSRIYADPAGQAMFSFEFRNAYGWSKPIYWNNNAGNHTASEFWNGLGYFPNALRGTMAIPNYPPRTHYPSSLSASPIDHVSIRLNWTDAQQMPDPNLRAIHYRELRRAGLTRGPWISYGNSAPPMVISGLQSDKEYEFLVHGGAGWRWSSFPVAKTLPPIHPQLLQDISPSGLTASVNSESQITLFWTRNASSNDAVELYFENGTGIATVGAGVTSYTIGGLAANTTYRFKVRNRFSGGSTYSEWSNVAQATTSMPPDFYAPSGLSWSASGATVYLNWNKNNGDNAVVEMNSGGGWTVVANRPAGSQSYNKYIGYDASAWFRVKNTSPVDTPYTNEVQAYTEPTYDPCGGGIYNCA